MPKHPRGLNTFPQKYPQTVEYLSAIDVQKEAVGLEDDGFCTVTFDAIPLQLLPFLRRATSQEIVNNLDTALSFLLMEARVPKSVAEEAMRNDGWCLISVADTHISGDNAFPATALEFSIEAQESNPTVLFVKISALAPSAKDLHTLKRVIECRHHQGAAFDYLGLQPNNSLFVAIYDVGQASMSAIIDHNNKPKAFFDFGWPIGFFRRTLPTCRGFNPLAEDDSDHPAPVFLSHLDWDHWGYAYESGRPIKDRQSKFWKTSVTYKPGVLQRPWVMRRPSAGMKLGISHAHLMYSLQNQVLQDGSSALKFWPARRKEIQWGACTLFACNPVKGMSDAKYLRNNEALGMLVENSQSPYYRRVLLCGDADYTSIPMRFQKNLGGIVAPHHGGEVTPGTIPVPNSPNTLYRYMVFSTHEGCYSNIPSTNTITEAANKGWVIRRTDERSGCDCCRGERRNRWFSLADRPMPGRSHSCRCLTLK
ncbi:hypothetical protein [Pseudomonas sp. YJ42]|uniref:hypothetical protein n=1 Tax=Pseudomonas sp. YJ42 TaxID=3392115 RepID=UPI0039A2D4DF